MDQIQDDFDLMKARLIPTSVEQEQENKHLPVEDQEAEVKEKPDKIPPGKKKIHTRAAGKRAERNVGARRVTYSFTMSEKVYERLKIFSSVTRRNMSDILEEGAVAMMKGFDVHKALEEIWKDD